MPLLGWQMAEKLAIDSIIPVYLKYTVEYHVI
jgi:hypothetical protein